MAAQTTWTLVWILQTWNRDTILYLFSESTNCLGITFFYPVMEEKVKIMFIQQIILFRFFIN